MGDMLEDMFAQLNQNIISLTRAIGKLDSLTEGMKMEINKIHTCGCEQGKKEYLDKDRRKKDYKSIAALIAAGGLILKEITQGLYEFIIKLLSTHRL